MKKSIKLSVLFLMMLGFNQQLHAQDEPDSSLINSEMSEMESTSPETTNPDSEAMMGNGLSGNSELTGNDSDVLMDDEEEEDAFAMEDLADTTMMIVDGYMDLNTYDEAKPIPLPVVDPANVKFYKRVWREIDLRDSANVNIFFLPDGTSFTQILVNAVKRGRIIAYDPRPSKKDPTGDRFKRRFTPAQAMGRLVDSVLVPQFDEMGNQIGSTMMLNEFNPENITKYRVKEDIFFDKQRSRFETRIVGIAPLKKLDVGGEELSEVVFWLHFPSIRKVLVTKECKDEMTYDDIFIQHAFASNIVRDSKSPNKKIEDPALAEKQIENYKENSWKY